MQLRRIWRTKQNNSLCHPQENEKFNNDNKCQQVYKSLFLDKNTFFLQNIWSIQKKAVILQPISEKTKPRWRNR